MAKKQAKHTGWKVVATASSESSKGTVYKIERADSGALRCSCKSFRYKKFPLGHPNKTCKHLDSLKPVLGEES